MNAEPEVQEDALTTSFEVAGVLRHHRSKTATNCRCCRGIPGEGHIFAFGVELEQLTAGADGPRPESPTEWLNQVLYPLRGHDGARVRITVEVERDA